MQGKNLLYYGDNLDILREFRTSLLTVAAVGNPSRQYSGGDFYPNQNLRIGKRFASAVFQAANEGKLLYSEAYRLTGLYGRTFDNYADYLAGKRAS